VIFAALAYLITCIPHAEAQLTNYQLTLFGNTVINHNTGLIAEQLTPTTNDSFKDAIDTILTSHEFTHEYVADIFDCSEMSRLTCNILRAYNFDARPIFNIKEGEPYGHMWVVVFEDGSNSPVAAIECCDTPNRIGEIVTPALTRKWHSKVNWITNDYYQGYLTNNTYEMTDAIGLSDLEWNVAPR